MQNSVFILGSLFMGSMLSIYLPMNSAVSRHLGSSITANITFFLIAFISSILIFLFWGEYETIKKINKVPYWLYLSGAVSALMVLGTTYLIPRVGIRQFFILVVSGQLLCAIIMSHYAFLGTPRDPVSIKKLIGAFLVILGAIFSTI
ncbi:MAG: DMT family transporter [Deltaproteobacteria bacterium]|nr:DMT family transporter [Deltaproteobacteria bacterium]